jgi:hypothetical protein
MMADFTMGIEIQNEVTDDLGLFCLRQHQIIGPKKSISDVQYWNTQAIISLK